MSNRPRPAEIKLTTYVTRKIWGPDDDYLVISVGDIQVHEADGWEDHQCVELIIKVRNVTS